MKRLLLPASAGVALALVLSSCGSDDAPQPAGQQPTTTATPTSAVTSSAYQPAIDPAAFTTTIDNPWLPFPAGRVWTYEGDTEDGRERTVVTVLSSTKVVMGVTCVVVHDVVSVDGEIVEDTYDWYAQHRDGSVWYFGEDTKEIEDGKVVSTHGAWEAGVSGAQPGIVMPAAPKAGDHFRQEFALGEAEDEFRVIALGVTQGSLTDLLETEEFTRLEPEVVERKYYKRGVGNVLVVHVKGPAERVELVSVSS